MSVIMIDSSFLAATTGVLAIVADLDNKATLKDLDRMTKVTDFAKVESSRPAIHRLLQELNGIDDSSDDKNGINIVES